MLDSKVLTFLEVAAQGSYTRAAENLHLTQPAVTQQIHRLEEHYGHQLVDTCGRTVRLTEAGEKLERHARMQLVNERRFMERLAAEEPPLGLGATLSIADYYLPRPLGRALAGGAGLRVCVGNTQALTERMLEGDLDCALVEGMFDRALFEARIRLTAWLAVPLALAFAVGGAAVNAENARHLGAENIEKYTLPKLHYIAMGLPVQSDEGYGQYGYGGWLVFSTSFDDPQERDAALLEEVIDRVYYLRYPSRLLNMMSRKNLSTFGDGTFRLNEIIEGDVRDPDNLVKQFVFAPGQYYPLYYHLCTAMFLAQMLLACLACAQMIKRRQTHAAALFVTLLGIFLFLCMWETRARYFFQFELVLLCAGAMLETPCREGVPQLLFRRRHVSVPGSACAAASVHRP